ncbi:stress response protein nst1-like isoform X1 [Portunus trituberculatus]|nr:stress response protein nst1-like isoform X1 [Portunus trituberculatus]XP_045103352.1 stress response protein nst1-like isoform X1 [Portunus trituberculatus]XP_045103353.1 stress response protein nst1-like isoform X1 [Portunus trituberculatus]
MEGVRAVWVLLALVAGVFAAPPTPTDTKRSGEDIQFGNQQNPPVSLLDDNAMAGAFPSSETTEELPTPVAQTHKQEAVEVAVGVAAQAVVDGLKEEQKQQQQHQQQEQEQKTQQEERLKQDKDEAVEQEDKDSKEEEEEVKRQQQQQQQETQIADVEAAGEEQQRWDDETNLWHNQPAAHDFYRSYLNVPRIIGNGIPSLASRRRRSLHLPPLRSHPIKGGTLAGVRTLLGRGQQQRRKRDLRRFRRDLNMNGMDLDRLLKNVDMKELLSLLSRPQHHQEGYGTVHYAPAPARYAPQPKLFPDYEEEWGEDAEELLRHGLRAEQPAEGVSPVAVVMPPGRVWRKSSPPGYGLARVPGFKRSSAFRSNTLQDPPPQATRPFPALTPRDVYSLAAMLGAERDPLGRRIRRAAM